MSSIAGKSTFYFCIQIEGRERFPYGIRGPFRTNFEAQQALASLAEENPSERLRICEGGWFSAPLEIEWNSQYELMDFARNRGVDAHG